MIKNNTKSKLSSVAIISLILFSGITPFLSKSVYDLKLKESSIVNLPPDKVVQFSDSPEIIFGISYDLLGRIEMNIFLRNNLSVSINLLNLWIRINKSDSEERILLWKTKIIETTDKLSLSTFDTSQSIIFHLKLYEGETLTPTEEYNVKLTWEDSDDIFPTYDPNLLHNNKVDDIEAFFEYSTDIEESQLFPLIEREFYQSLFFQSLNFNVDFRVTNLMATDLSTFNFTSVKLKDYIFENYLGLEIESPFLTSTEISNIELSYSETNDKIEYKVSFNQDVIIEPNEWFKIKTRWNGEIHKSSIARDLVIWNTGKDDPFNYGSPFYDIGLPFYPILSPAEPNMDIDYDGDGLRNSIEYLNNLDPYVQESWLAWQTLRSDYSIDAQYANNLEIGGKVGIIIPSDFSDRELIMVIQSLGSDDTLQEVQVNDEIVVNEITTEGQFSLAYPANEYVYNVKLRVSHDDGNTLSSFLIKFFIGNTEIIDLSSYFLLDSDGDGLIDEMEESPYDQIPDVDNDGIMDGNDAMPFNAIDCTHVYGISTFNIPVYDSSSEVGVNIQIKPTEIDYTETFDYRGNTLSILPGLRIYGPGENGDSLPDNSFSIDNGYSSLISLIPLNSYAKEKDYSWARMLTYKSDNPAKNDRQIKLNFILVWLIFEYNTITKESKLLHIYNNEDLSYTVQGVSITESQPTNIVLGLVEDGSDYRKTGMNAELAAYLQVANIDYNPNDISSLELNSTSCLDISDLNNTRDNLRNSILNQKNLAIEDTNFIFLTYGYTLTYSFELLIDELGYNPTKVYTSDEINNLYSRPEMSFIGIIATQLIKNKNIEFIKQLIYGYKNKSVETLRYTVQFSKCKYVASACDEIYQFEGIREEDNIWLFLFDFKEKDNLIKSSSGGQAAISWNFPIMRISLSGPSNKTLININGLYDGIPVLGNMFDKYLNEYEGDKAMGQIPIKLADIGVFVTTILDFAGKASKLISALGVLGKGMGAFAIVLGGMRFAYGIDQVNQGAYKTGMAENFRGAMSIWAGVLAFLPVNPVTLVLAALVLVATLADWIASLFDYDLWGELLAWCGVEDANPEYELVSYTLSYNNWNLKHHGSFRVGDSISFYIKVKNTGNTELTFGLQVDLGATGSPGTRKEMWTKGGKYQQNYGSTTATDNFDEPGPLTKVKISTDVSYFFHLGKQLTIVWYPPWVIMKDYPDVEGGPYDSSEILYFDMPVMPNTLEEFVVSLKDGSWLSGEWTEMQPETSVTPIDDEIIPMSSERLKYDVYIQSRSSNDQTYNLFGSNEELWDYNFYIDGIATSSITIEPSEQRRVRVVITPTAINPLTSGNYTTIIRLQHEAASIVRSNLYLDYEIIPRIDFDVTFDPILIEGLDLGGDGYLPYYINVTNIGNEFDNYRVEIINLDEVLYDLYKPELFAYPSRKDSALVVFYIPWGKIVLPGEIYFKINVSSEADPSLVEIFDCILDIQEYHRMSFYVMNASLHLTDSDIFNFDLHLTNLGNVEVPFDISWTNVSFANTYIENKSITMIPGQYNNFNLTLIPFELGHENFTIKASTPYISSNISASIRVTDDDILPPWFENVIIRDNCFFLNISFLAFDAVEWHSDDVGIANICIYVDDELIHNYLPTPYETQFNFSFTNDWIMEYGNHTIRIEITDADNDRPNDALTTVLNDTFEVTPDEMMEYILWELSELNDYINNELEFCFNRPLVNSLSRAQCKVQRALDYYNTGRITKAVLFDMLAKAGLEFYDIFTYILLKHSKITEEVADYIFKETHKIRDHISLTMGAIIGTDTALEIANIIVDISTFADSMFSEFNLFIALSIDCYLWRAVDELDFVLVLMSADSIKENLILKHTSRAISKLESTKMKIECLLNYNLITEEQATSLYEEFDGLIDRINNLNLVAN